jgi:pimeloyl-ACP methyl ester carboxylesterase
VAKFTRKQKVFIFLFVLVASIGFIGAVLLHPVGPHLRAMSLLLRFSSPQAQGLSASFAQHPFKEEDGSVETLHSTLRYRLYLPQGGMHGAMVLLHGVHHLGIEEPRLVSFARSLAGTGVVVMTPELKDLADYHITSETIDLIGQSAVILSDRVDRPVGMMGLSFAGGLALLAANRPEYSRLISFVLAVGAHDDMGRVARFFATNTIENADGSSTSLPAHEYGVLVLAYSHLDHFFSAQDMRPAQIALRLWLWERTDDAMVYARQMSPAGQAKFDQLVHHHELLRPQIMQEIERHSEEMQAVSPHGHISQLNVPVYLLHGSGDSVIPASETMWLAKDVPPKELKAWLVSPALIHVSMEETIPFSQKWALVDFLAQVLDATDKLPSFASTQRAPHR